MMAPTPLPGDVHRALRLLGESSELELSMSALARACQVTPRTLQRHFRQFLGQSPSEVLRDIRLDRIRRELLLGRDGVSVSERAIRYGFNHLGRFAGWFRKRFGETPSATLRRAQKTIVPPSNSVVPVFTGLDRPTVAVLPFHAEGPTVPARLLPDERLALFPGSFELEVPP